MLAALAMCAALDFEQRSRTAFLPSEYVTESMMLEYRSAILTAADGDADEAARAISAALEAARAMDWDTLKAEAASCDDRFAYLYGGS